MIDRETEILREEIKILSLALRNMFRTLKFSEEYASLLQEYISQEDYDDAMKEYPERLNKYAYEPRQLPSSEIVKEAKVVIDAIGKELSSDDIADILELEVVDVERALQQYTSKQSE